MRGPGPALDVDHWDDAGHLSHTELAFTFQGVAVGDVGSRISIAAAAQLDGDREQGNNRALLTLPVVAATVAATQ